MLNIIQNNPYRFLGIFSNSPIREKVANTNRLNAYLNANKQVTFPLDNICSLGTISRTTDGLGTANGSLNLPKDQLKYALFWFINATDIDNMALQYLQNGNVEKAEELLCKRDNFSSLINRGVLYFVQENDGEAIRNITKVIHEEEYAESFVNAICGNTFTIDEEGLAHLFIDTLLEEMNPIELKSLFLDNGVSGDDDDYLTEKTVGTHIAKINEAIGLISGIDTDDAGAQYEAGVRLMNSTKESLNAIRQILGPDDSQYQMVADNLAKRILQCGINYYNNADEDEDVEIDKAFTLQNYALSIAIGKLTKDRCKQNVDILKKKKAELPPKEVRYYDKMIKESLAIYMTQPDKICHAIDLIEKVIPYLMSIKEVLGSTNSYYLKISTLIANASLHNVIEEFNSVMNDSMQLRMIIDRNSAIRQVLNVFIEAWNATLYMDKLDMEPDFKNGRYYQNRSSLKSQVEQLIDVYGSVTLDMRGETKIFNDCRSISDLNNYTRLFPGGKYASEVKAKIEKIEFDTCKTTQDCKRFQNKYPNTRYDINSKWEDCYFKQCNTITQFKSYLKDYPNGRYCSQAKSKIDELSYKECRSVADYKKYMSNFPKGEFVIQAKRIIDDEEMWNRCITTDSRDMYKDYLAKFPNGRHKTEAEKKAHACYIATMVYGDYNHPQVIVLRDFRDSTLQNSVSGRAFIQFYYKNSPSWVKKLQNKKILNKIIKSILDAFIIIYNMKTNKN